MCGRFSSAGSRLRESPVCALKKICGLVFFFRVLFSKAPLSRFFHSTWIRAFSFKKTPGTSRRSAVTRSAHLHSTAFAVASGARVLSAWASRQTPKTFFLRSRFFFEKKTPVRARLGERDAFFFEAKTEETRLARFVKSASSGISRERERERAAARLRGASHGAPRVTVALAWCAGCEALATGADRARALTERLERLLQRERALHQATLLDQGRHAPRLSLGILTFFEKKRKESSLSR